MKTSPKFLVTFLALLAVGVQIGTATGAQAQPTAEQRAQYRAAMQRADQAMALIDRADRTIDRSQLDPLALVGRLDADPGRIVAFVRSRIAYQPYPGALRGIRGTLMTRAGNALDQSLLLASLLHDAGYEARIDYAPLSDVQSRQVLAEAARPATPSPAPVNVAALNALAKTAPEAADPALKKRLQQAIQPPVYTGPPATVMASWLMQSLHKAGIKLGSKRASARFFKSAHDYFWVEYRSDPWARWQTVQPVFADAAHDFTDLHARKRYPRSIPERWQWRLHLKLVIEAWHGDNLGTTNLLDWTRPVGNLAGKPLSIAVSPTNLSSRVAFKNLKQTLAQAQLFSASFDGARTGDLFDLSGNTVDPEALSGGMPGAAGVFMTMNKKAQATAGALAALGGHGGKTGQKPMPTQVLTGVWIEVTVIPPDGYGRPRHQRRYLLDRIGEAQRRTGKVAHLRPMKSADIARRLTSSYTFVVSGGRPALGLIIARYLNQLKREWPLLRYAAELDYLHKDDGVVLGEYFRQQKPAALTQLGLLRTSVVDVGTTRSYRPAPAIVSVENSFGPKYQAIKQTDIVFDPVAMLPTDGAPITVATSATASPTAVQASPNPTAALAVGVRMTRLETDHNNGIERFAKRSSAYGQLAAAREAGLSVEVIRPAEDDRGWEATRQKVAGLKVSVTSRDAIMRDLDEGFLVVVPRQQAPKIAAWWRVNPATGEALGMSADGRGDEFVEYLTTLFNAAFLAGNTFKLALDISSCTTLCCKLHAFATYGAGLALGITSGTVGFVSGEGFFFGLAMLGINVTNTISNGMGGYTPAGAAGEKLTEAVCSGS